MELLITILVLAIVIYAVSVVLGMVDLPAPIKTLVWLVIAVIVIIKVLGMLGTTLTI